MGIKSLAQGPVITVHISYNEAGNVHEFLYVDEKGNPTDGTVIVTTGEIITYKMASSDINYSFVGAGFITPCDGVIESTCVSSDGQTLELQDEDSVVGKTSFQLIIKCPQSANWLLSPDPQVINRDTK
ncbi:DP-EP family protein [Shewanella sp. Scap07]|uniref:DP-EP family protein n=1 Tax=Shewanella sp. Scap07 TaxID=2589987 RepID=UPI0015C0FDAC|nr:DP-EP family protein [Shewanella sp. Scap07]QLE85263.1 DP-EP family protein [Shewanella sp. Scap07]